MVREADNSFDALRIAQGMENAGASVFSISHKGMRHPEGAMIPSASFVVWAKHPETLDTDDIDRAINKEFGEDDEQ